jgi:hypothetical protein
MLPTRRALVIRCVFVALVPCLLAQIGLSRKTEPYPAILLPSYPEVLRDDGSYTAYETTLVAEDARGQEHPFPVSALLDTVPSSYRGVVVDSGLGLTRDRDVRHVRIPFPGGGFVLRFGRPLTPSQADDTRRWLESRLLRNLGLDVVRIHVLTYSIRTFERERPVRRVRTLEGRKTLDLVGAGR